MDRINLLFNIVRFEDVENYFYGCVDNNDIISDVGYLVDDYNKSLLFNNIIIKHDSGLLVLTNDKICKIKYG